MASRISSRALAISRQCSVRGVRFESTTSQAAQGAKEAAQKVGNVAGESAAKAKEAASSAATKASSAATAAAQRAQSALGPQLNRLQSLQQPVVYYSKLTAELAKQVYTKEKMAPPNVTEIQNAYKQIFEQVRSPSKAADSLKDPNSLMKLGVVSLELLGFFTIGEMIGRWHIVGYNLPPPGGLHTGL